MNAEDQANLSLRERAIKDKEKIQRLRVKSPDHRRLFGLKINAYTIFFCSTPQKRQRLAEKIPSEYDYYVDRLENIEPIQE